MLSETFFKVCSKGLRRNLSRFYFQGNSSSVAFDSDSIQLVASCGFQCSEYNSLARKGNCTKYKLCNAKEKNPGPVMHYVDPTKTKVPDSLGDVVLFAQNARQQCVAMSLCFSIPQYGYERNK